MNTKDNQRARLTRKLLKEAYMSLMGEKPTGKITVKDICDRAEINRSTFYLHYAEANDILMELEDETIESVRGAIAEVAAMDEPSPDVSDSLTRFLQYIRRNEELFRTFLVENSDPHFRKKFLNVAREIAEAAFRVEIEPEKKESVYLYIVSGCLEVLTDWIRSGFALPERALSEVLFGLCEGGLRSVCL